MNNNNYKKNNINFGDNNEINFGEQNINIESNMPTPTEIYTLLTIFYNDNNEIKYDFDMNMPAEPQKKLNYNNVKKFQKNINMYMSNAELFDNVIKDFNESEIIVCTIRFMYSDYFETNPETNFIEGDKILYNIYKEIKKRIKNDRRIYTEEFSEEKIDIFIRFLISYSILECKVLENPNVERGT